jgi:creatinine amidohydrolase
MNSVWMQDLTSDEIEVYLKSEMTAIVPIGATETHGPHLPLGTDTFEAIDYAEEIARRASVPLHATDLVRRLTPSHGPAGHNQFEIGKP